MSDNQLSRRKVLGALATTGGAGALVGTGTGALFTDEETFTDDGIRTSTSVAGTVDLEIDDTVPDDRDEVIYDVELPDGGNNNPAYVWFRADCPEEKELDLACATSITVEVECDGKTVPVASGSVRDVFNALRNGRLLCGGDTACLEVGEIQTLEIRITDVEEYDGDADTLTFDLEFYGEQCRYNTGTKNPFDDRGECDECPDPRQELSYVAFCAEGADEKPEPEITEVNARNDDGPTSVDWTINNGVDIDYVVAKTGQGGSNEEYIVYDYSDPSESVTNGTAAVGDDDADFLGDENDVEDYETNGDVNQDPRQFAKDALELSEDFNGKSARLEDDKGELDP
jgi:hypothetical protein